MYPFSSSDIGNSSFTSSNQPRGSNSSFLHNYNNDTYSLKSPQEHYFPPSSSSLHFLPNHILLEDELFQPISDDHIYQNTVNVVAHDHPVPGITTNVQCAMEKCRKNNGQFNTLKEPKSSSPRKSSKKDRHSKINTIRGPRDRRMRLSLDVARKFFGLQDMLGFDKASKTVEWLLTKSKFAIQELLPHRLNKSCSFIGVSNSASSTSECEVLSGIDDQSMVKTGSDDIANTEDKAKSSSCTSSKEKKKIAKGVRRSAHLHHPLAKETRERARARARERVMEKRNNALGCDGGGDQYSKFGPCLDQQTMDQDLSRLGSWSPFEETQVQIIDQYLQPSCYHFQVKQGIVSDNYSLMTGNWSPSILNYQHNAGLSHENQFSDFQQLAKPWEGNNNN